MSDNYVEPEIREELETEFLEEVPIDPIFFTKAGVRVPCQAISPMLLQKLRVGGEDAPKPPTYSSETATGEILFLPHDKDSLETEEDRVAWEKYLAETQKYNQERSDRMMNLFYLKGVMLDLPEDASWAEEQEFLGIEIPSSRMQRRIHWLQTEIFKTPEDITGVMAKVMELTGVSPEALAEVRGMFRRSVQRKAAARVAAEAGDAGRNGEPQASEGVGVFSLVP